MTISRTVVKEQETLASGLVASDQTLDVQRWRVLGSLFALKRLEKLENVGVCPNGRGLTRNGLVKGLKESASV